MFDVTVCYAEGATEVYLVTEISHSDTAIRLRFANPAKDRFIPYLSVKWWDVAAHTPSKIITPKEIV